MFVTIKTPTEGTELGKVAGSISGYYHLLHVLRTLSSPISAAVHRSRFQVLGGLGVWGLQNLG